MASKRDDYSDSVAGTNLWWLKRLLRFIAVMCMYSIIAIILDIVFSRYIWEKGTGVDHMEQLVNFALLQPVNQKLAKYAAEGFYWLYFKWNFIHQAATEFANGELPHTLISNTIRKVLIVPFRQELAIGMYGAKLFGIRLASLLMALPLYGLVCVIASIDGLTERYIRRMGVGRESATIYHRSKHYAFGLIPPLVGFIYLVLPYSVPPILIFFPTVLLSGLLLRTQMKYYKKYL